MIPNNSIFSSIVQVYEDFISLTPEEVEDGKLGSWSLLQGLVDRIMAPKDIYILILGNVNMLCHVAKGIRLQMELRLLIE